MVADLFTKIYVKLRARKYKIKCPEDIDGKLEYYRNIFCDKKIIFSRFVSCSSKILNAGLLFKKVILFNSEWAAQLVLFPTAEAENAFVQTVGHELSHVDDYVFYEFLTRDKKFVNWVNEVHADFSSAEKCSDFSRDKLIAALDFKCNKKGSKDHPSPTHPSWKIRLEYARNYNFDEKLILKIADDTGCKNQVLINKVIKHFKTCVLT